MEFQAYPTTMPAGRKGVQTLLKIQNKLHSTDSILLPASMLLIASSLAAYQHFTHWDTSRKSIRNFLLRIILSMVPLAILEVKVPKCADPVGLFANFSTKVMLMHAGFLALRWIGAFWEVGANGFSFTSVMLLAACILLPTVFGFRPTPKAFRANLDVILLIAVALTITFLEISMFSSIKWSKWRLMHDFVCTSSDYIEITAFVPAVWMAYRRGEDAAEQDVAQVSLSQRRALCLFAFMVVFYSMEDAVNAIDLWNSGLKIAASGLAAHYMLLLDFAGFLLAHLCDPVKLRAMRALMIWLTDACAV